jgi:hypothetical protein
MKFQLKALVVAVAMIATVPAQAAIDGGLTGNSSLLLAVYDRPNNVGALFDLGLNYSDFNVIGSSFANSGVTNEGTFFSWDLTSGDYSTAWSQFTAATNSANLVFGVIATDTLGTGAGSRGIIQTYNAESISSISGLAMNTNATGLNPYIADAGSTATIYQNHTLVDNGASYGNSGLGNIMNYFLDDKPNRSGTVATGAIGSSLGVLQTVYGATNAAQAPFQIFGNGAAFTLSANGLLTYTTNDPVVVVPEADTWAMMLLGLGFMGFAARRKQV